MSNTAASAIVSISAVKGTIGNPLSVGSIAETSRPIV
jgi:hypothetical protein